MSHWFEGSISVDCSYDHVISSFAHIGLHYKRQVDFMPGVHDVTLVESSSSRFEVKTNEGRMIRENITIKINKQSVEVTFRETYRAGSMMTATSNFVETYTSVNNAVEYALVIESVKTSGVLGFFYRNFGKKNIGNAVLKAGKNALESRTFTVK